MTTELVHLDIADGVATITLDSVKNRNALSRQLMTELSGHLDRARDDESVQVVVLTHTGKVFCAGADLGEAADGMQEGARALLNLLRTIAELPKPVLARIAGPVRAGGRASWARATSPLRSTRLRSPRRGLGWRRRSSR